MKKGITFIILFLTSALVTGVFAQKVYSCQYRSDADVKVFVTEYKSDADLVVYETKYRSDVNGNTGVWH